MDDSEFFVDSMYEMDAPRCVDFDATDVSVNESIFERKTVGERRAMDLSHQMDQMGFKSPSNVFKDIGNFTPRLLRSSTKPKNSPRLTSPKTPVNASPLLLDNSRRVTRSISKTAVAMNTTLTPTQSKGSVTSPSGVTASTHIVVPVSQSSASPIQQPEMDEREYPLPKVYSSRRRSSIGSPLAPKAASSVPKGRKSIGSPLTGPTTNNVTITKPTSKLRNTRASTSDLHQRPTALQPAAVRRSVGAKLSPAKSSRLARNSVSGSPCKINKPRTSSVTKQPRAAHSGTPFNGKSPNKLLRTRTRSQDSRRSGPVSGSRPTASTKLTSVRQRTSSAGGTAGNQTNSTPNMRARAASQSSLSTASSNGATSFKGAQSKTVSPSLSRLMRPTESVRAKMHEANISPNKRRHSEQDESKPPKQPRNTIPKTPNFMSRSRTRLTPAKSTDDLILERAQEEKKQMASLKKMNDCGLKAIAGGNSARKDRKPPSLPTGKSHTMATRTDQVKAKRSFGIYDRLSTKTRSTSSLDDHVPKPKYDVYTKLTTTIPQSPKLQTRQRERPPRVPTSQERELMELEQMKQHQFKAAPLDKRIFETGALGVKQKERIPLTAPIPVKFATDVRLAQHAEKRPENPQSADQPMIKAMPAPKPGAVFQPKLSHKCTTVAPFTFESKDEEMKRKRADLKRRVEEEERKLREFKANPLPPSPSPLPQRQVLAPTIPEPFNLRIDERGQTQQEKLKQKIEEENARMLEATVIHARPADVLKRQPFVPKKEPAKTTEPLNIELSSARRAGERREYEEKKRLQQEEAERLDADLRKIQEEEERQERIRVRQETVIKPAPIKHYKPVLIKQSDKPLTLPRSPAFSKR